MSTIHQPPIETVPDVPPTNHQRAFIIALVAVSAALVGVLIASFLMIGNANTAKNNANTQLHSTQSQLRATQASLAASNAKYAALNGAAVVGNWLGTDSSGWSGTMVINSDHTFSFNASDGSGSADGTWALVAPGKMLIVEPDNSNTGSILSYTLSADGHKLAYTDSNAPDITTTLNK